MLIHVLIHLSYCIPIVPQLWLMSSNNSNKKKKIPSPHCELGSLSKWPSRRHVNTDPPKNLVIRASPTVSKL